MDEVSSAVRRRNMAAIRSSNTKVERLVYVELRRLKVYHRRHYRGVVGTPDIALPSKKIAVFIDGDFWHGFRFPQWKSRLTKYWKEKISRNRKRDTIMFRKLRRSGWKVTRVWDHQLKKDFKKMIEKILTALRS